MSSASVTSWANNSSLRLVTTTLLQQRGAIKGNYLPSHSSPFHNEAFSVKYTILIKVHNASHSTVEPRNSVQFGHPKFFCYCGVFRYFSGSILKK